jgi:Methylamine utilisation protein MauE
MGPMSTLDAWWATAVWALGFVLLLSGTGKLRHPLPAALAMAGFGLGGRRRTAAARALGAVELALGVALAGRLALPLALAITTALFVAFAALLARALLRGERFPCGCFGADDAMISGRTLVRAALLAGIAFGALVATVAGDAAAAPPLRERLLTGVTAAGLLALAALAVNVPKLTRWNAEPGPVIRQGGGA